MMDTDRPVGVIGAGAWGTALAQVIASDGTAVRIWAMESDVVDAINTAHENNVYLSGHPLSSGISATADKAEGVAAFRAKRKPEFPGA